MDGIEEFRQNRTGVTELLKITSDRGNWRGWIEVVPMLRGIKS